MLKQRVKHYKQWLHFTIHLDTNIDQSSPDPLGIRSPSERCSSGLLHPISPDQERYRKGGKWKISRVLQSPVSSPQASLKVQACHRPQHAQHLSGSKKGSKWKHQSPSGPL